MTVRFTGLSLKCGASSRSTDSTYPAHFRVAFDRRQFSVTVDTDFDGVIRACAGQASGSRSKLDD